MDDEHIIELYFARDEEAIRQTESRYGRKLLRLSENIVGSREDAEESVSDTYLKTWNTVPPKRPGNLFAYLAKICRNLSLDRLDWFGAAKRRAEVVSLTQEMEQCVAGLSGEEVWEARELCRCINGFLETLTPENRMVFVRRYWYVDSVPEIAQRYGIQEGTLVTRLHRIRARLSEYLKKEGYTL